MAYLDDWLEAMTEGADPQEASRLRRTARGPTLRDLLGQGNNFEIMGPNGQVDVARTEEFLNRPNRGPSLETGNFSVFSPGGSLNAESARNLSTLLKANPSIAMSPEERQGQEKEAEAMRERDLYTRAQRGDREAVAEFERRKGQQLNLKMLIDLAKGDPDTARALLERMIPGLAQGKGRLQRIGEKARVRAEATQDVAANKPIPAKDFGLWVTPTGKSLQPENFKGKTEGNLLEGGHIRLNDAQTARSLSGAKRVIQIGDQIGKAIPDILTRVGKSKLGDIFEVQGNKLAIKAKEFAGDPAVRKLQAFMIDYLVSVPIAMGLAAGREGPRLLEVLQPGVPHLTDTVESALEVIDANAKSINAAWLHRGIDLYGERKMAGAGQAPSVGEIIKGYRFKGGNPSNQDSWEQVQ